MVTQQTIQKVRDALEKNGMTTYYLSAKEEVVPLLETLIPAGSTVGIGGSMTLFEAGVIDHLRQPKYHLFDRYQEGLSRQSVEKIYRDSLTADVYLSSTNALTEEGELYNVDGNGNRVAALVYGPKSVIIIAGINKIVPDLEAAIYRVKTVAAPKNCVRLHCKTYCQKAGKCVSLRQPHPGMTDGCSSPTRICRHYHVAGPQRQKGRIQVILVGESLGY